MTAVFWNQRPANPIDAQRDQTKEKTVGNDPINPDHYRTYPGLEVIQLTEHLNFCLGNVIKYVLRAEHKGKTIEDLRKAQWYLQREIDRRTGNNVTTKPKSHLLDGDEPL